jgi:hypothetical protein
MKGCRNRSRHLRRNARSTLRRALRRPLRRLDGSCLRALLGHRRGPDDLAQALTAFTRAIRCHRRLARLAPRFFDATVADREARQHAERRRMRELWAPALDLVYGPGPDRPLANAEADLPPLPSRRTQRAVERELAAWDLWMTAGQIAWDQQRQRRPHAVPSLTQVARLIQIAIDFGALACGPPSADGTPEPSRFDNYLADLERAYGPRRP